MFNRIKDNTTCILIQLVNNLGVNVTKTTVQESLQNHPDYPSLTAISDCLNEWKVDNQAFRLAINDIKLDKYEYPFVAHLRVNNGELALIKSIHDGHVSYSNENGENQIMDYSLFLKQWDGITLLARKNKDSGEANYFSKLIFESFNQIKWILTLILMSTLIFQYFWHQGVENMFITLAVSTLAGVGLSALLLGNSINEQNPLIRNLCNLGGKSNCNAILKSEAAKLTPWLSWSEIGFFYFTGSLLSLLFLLEDSLPYLFILNVLALPYTFYSIYYQWKAKSWCILCCSIQVLLWLQFLIFTQLDTSLFLNMGIALMLMVSFLIPILIWSLIKSSLVDAAQKEPLRKQLNKFKYNDTLFNQALNAQPKIKIDDEISIVLGNRDADICITLASNPFCNPCGKAHQQLEDYFGTRSDVKLQIVFNGSQKTDEGKAKIIKHFLTCAKGTQYEIKELLGSWYSQNIKDYDKWSERYPLDLNDSIDDVLIKQANWFSDNQVQRTPTIFINGHQLPTPYQLEDLKYLLS